MFNLFGDFGSILLVILFVVLFIKSNNLKARVSNLEKKLGSTPEPQVIDEQAAPVVQNVVLESNTTADQFIDWLRDDWLMKLGGFLLLIGFGWFTTYAFMHDWIGPGGRITLGILAGIAILVLGTWRIKKYLNQGGVFLVLGSAVILLTVFAAREMYDMFTPAIALGIMFLSAAYVALVSVKYDSFAVALSGLVLSMVAPLLAGSTDNTVALFSYLLAVVLGVIWIVNVQKNWGGLVLASLVSVFLYSLPVITGGYYQRETVLLNFAYAFVLVFFVSSILSILKSKEGDIKAFLWTAVFNGAFLLFWVLSYAQEEWQSMIIAIWMVIFAGGAFVLFSETKIRNVFYIYGAVAVAMLVAATALELDGAALVLAYTVESAIIPVLIYFTTRDLKASSFSSLLVVGPVLLSFGALASYVGEDLVFTEDFFVLALLAIVLAALGLMYKNINERVQISDFNADNILLIGSSVYIYTLIWTSLHNAMSTDQAVATTIALIIFTIIGLVKYFYGISNGSIVLRNYGGLFLGLVVLRLIFIDVWDMEMGARIVVFFLVGILLVSTAFISRKIKSEIVTK